MYSGHFKVTVLPLYWDVCAAAVEIDTALGIIFSTSTLRKG